jgi:branched-chain amino acid transport system substrate-binding protein
VRRMSKRLFMILALLVMASLVLVACAPAEEAAPEAPAAEAPAAEEAEEAEEEMPAFECEDAIGCVEVAAGDPVMLAYMLPESGGAAVYGVAASNAMEIAIADFGSVAGHEVSISGNDSECSAEGGETVAQRLAADPSIVAVVGTTCSSAMAAAMNTLSEAGLTTISPSNTSPALGDPNDLWQPGYFRTAHNDLIQGANDALFAYNDLGARIAAAIHDGDPYTSGLAQAFADAFTALGGTITTFEAVNKGDTDMRSVLTTVAADSPDVLFFPIFQPEGDFIAAQSVEIAGLEDTILFGADGLFVAPFAPSAGAASLDMYISGPNLASDRVDAFNAAFVAHYGEAAPGPFGEHAYDGTMILLNAIVAVAREDADGNLLIGRQDLRDAVTATADFDGLTGTLTCAEGRDIGGILYNGECTSGGALGIFQVTQDWIDSDAAYPPPVIWTP